MPVDSAGHFADLLRHHHLLDVAQLAQLAGLQARLPEPHELARELLQRGWLTPYQANQLLQGRGRELVLGSYVLLERLGEGGMGAVFKARNWKLGKTVAVKVIRRERLETGDAVRRFQREIRAAAQLNHPNIVRAYDADEVAGTHFLVMEYVEGTDLSRLVKKEGPLAVAQACDYVRQAALGLQHAHERGLIHRDIKPHNLLRTADGVIKVLDMGLARLDQRRAEDGESATITRQGTVMGTPDYIAPEQALDSHQADIRADLYSLGCTLYYLLTGRVPFPRGNFMQKVLRHRLEEPTPVEQLRPEVPPAVAALVRRLMAKQPEDRFQAPRELADALAEVAQAVAAPAATTDDLENAATVLQVPVSMAPPAPTENPFAALGATEVLAKLNGVPRPGRRRWWIGGGVLGALAVAVAAVLLWPGEREERPATAPRPVEAKKKKPPDWPDIPSVQPVGEAWIEAVARLPAEEQVKAVAAKLRELNPGFDGRVLRTIENGVVTRLEFLTDHVADIEPVRALPGLKDLRCRGGGGRTGRLVDLTPLKGMRLTGLYCFSNPGLRDLTPLKGMPLKTLQCGGTGIKDLEALRGLRLETLDIDGTAVADLSPLAPMPLINLRCAQTRVKDLAPLTGLPLKTLVCSGTPVADLTPLEGLPLEVLDCSATAVGHLTPLKKMALKRLVCVGIPVADLTALKGLGLKALTCRFSRWRGDAAALRGLPGLEEINGEPAASFWKKFDAEAAAFDAWAASVSKLPVAKQVEAVAVELKKRNPGFDGKVTPTVAGGGVVGLVFPADEVADLAPVRSLPGLKSLTCNVTDMAKAKLSDLSPLRGLQLTFLNCGGTPVADLTPLRGMPLTYLNCGYTRVADLTPITDMPLTCLYCNCTRVSDLAPVRGMRLELLYSGGARVTDLSPLEGMPLHTLTADINPWRDAPVLRTLPALQSLNLRPAATFWKALEAFEAWAKAVRGLPADRQVEAVAAELKKRNPGFDGKVTPRIDNGVVTGLTFVTDQVTDLAPVRVLPGLALLACHGSGIGKGRLADLSPLYGLKLTDFDCGWTQVADLSPLKGQRLTRLVCYSTKVSDLTPLEGMPLTQLHCGWTPVADLSPVKRLPMRRLWVAGTRVTDLTPLQKLPLQELWCDAGPARKAVFLRAVKSLKTINGKPAARFWK